MLGYGLFSKRLHEPVLGLHRIGHRFLRGKRFADHDEQGVFRIQSGQHRLQMCSIHIAYEMRLWTTENGYATLW